MPSPMEEFQECRDEAKQRLRRADHLLTVTYPMVEDPKLLLSVLENLYYSLEKGMDSVLEYERLFKNIHEIPDGFHDRYEKFESEIASKHGIEKKHLKLLRKFREALAQHEDSPIEFRRGEKFVIADDEFDVKTLTADEIKEDLQEAKKFIEKVQEVVKENEGIVGRRERRAEEG